MQENPLKKHFPVFKENPGIVYLDSAASSLKPAMVIEAINYYYQHLGVNVHRGVYQLSYETTELFEESRKKIAAVLNCLEEEIVFTRGASSALNLVAASYREFVEEGDEIIVSELEHHSSLLPWIENAKLKGAVLKYVPLTAEGRITLENFLMVLSDKTKVVALTHVSNVLGYETPLEKIIKKAHEKKAIVIVDACQSIPHMAINVKELDCDFLAFSGHKMCGPTGVGVLFGKKALLSKMRPVEFGGDMVEFVYHDKCVYKDVPYRFETGTPMIAEVIALKAAFEFIESVGYEKIKEIEKKLMNYTLEKMQKIKGVKIYNPKTEGNVILFNIDGVHPHDAASIFDKNNVCLRAGHHCAQLVSRWLSCPSTLRASFYLYNDYRDCDLFLKSVEECAEFFSKF